MKYTNNYHLPQWSEDDLILMDDFNSAMENLENGIDGAKAEAKAASDEAAAVANSAKVTANAAKTAADAALASKPYVIGSYVGSDADKSIYLGFRPRFVIISGARDSGTANGFTFYTAISAGVAMPTQLVFTDTGFKVTYNGLIFPRLSESGRIYDYIAFK